MSHPLGYNPAFVFRADPAPGNLIKRLLGQQGDFPQVFIAGAQKSGTTSLYAALATHPAFAKPELKEPFYYGNEDRFKLGRKFYLRNFPKQKPGQFSVDASTNYLDHPLAAKRILADVPSAKIIILLRNPVARAFSHYRMQVKNGAEELSFSDAIANENTRIGDGAGVNSEHNYCYQRLGYRSRGEYSRMLKPWLEKFPKKQLLILIADDFFADPKRVYADVLNFLQIEQHIPPQIEIMNAGTPAPADQRTFDALKEHYRPFNTELAAMLKTDLSRWD